jgi:7,8-dihydropterin-6-yl-methyl-4-(beta-D-ribofuranosyl)aminobenzene 5'-phosphate synthase
LPDPYVWDDRAIVVNVKDKGLVIMSGCAHAGIINTILYAQKTTGITDILAVIGGFHLSGREYEERIDDTVRELKRLKPKILVPTHCTGWRGFYAIRKEFRQTCIWNSVGNLYKL